MPFIKNLIIVALLLILPSLSLAQYDHLKSFNTSFGEVDLSALREKSGHYRSDTYGQLPFFKTKDRYLIFRSRTKCSIALYDLDKDKFILKASANNKSSKGESLLLDKNTIIFTCGNDVYKATKSTTQKIFSASNDTNNLFILNKNKFSVLKYINASAENSSCDSSKDKDLLSCAANLEIYDLAGNQIKNYDISGNAQTNFYTKIKRGCLINNSYAIDTEGYNDGVRYKLNGDKINSTELKKPGCYIEKRQEPEDDSETNSPYFHKGPRSMSFNMADWEIPECGDGDGPYLCGDIDSMCAISKQLNFVPGIPSSTYIDGIAIQYKNKLVVRLRQSHDFYSTYLLSAQKHNNKKNYLDNYYCPNVVEDDSNECPDKKTLFNGLNQYNYNRPEPNFSRISSPGCVKKIKAHNAYGQVIKKYTASLYHNNELIKTLTPNSDGEILIPIESYDSSSTSNIEIEFNDKKFYSMQSYSSFWKIQ